MSQTELTHPVATQPGTSQPDEVPTLPELLASLPALAAEVRLADERLRERVAQVKERRATWAEIGAALGISRQAAWERFGRGTRRTT